ncbi:hypothetical protein J6590_001365 [Homalodisca vitripennis]|nr:hypothetical protein J6590_001365 [Homalodisca vitripennis]
MTAVLSLGGSRKRYLAGPRHAPPPPPCRTVSPPPLTHLGLCSYRDVRQSDVVKENDAAKEQASPAVLNALPIFNNVSQYLPAFLVIPCGKCLSKVCLSGAKKLWPLFFLLEVLAWITVASSGSLGNAIHLLHV